MSDTEAEGGGERKLKVNFYFSIDVFFFFWNYHFIFGIILIFYSTGGICNGVGKGVTVSPKREKRGKGFDPGGGFMDILGRFGGGPLPPGLLAFWVVTVVWDYYTTTTYLPYLPYYFFRSGTRQTERR